MIGGGDRNRLDTFSAAWSARDGEATHHFVLGEGAEPGPGTLESLRLAAGTFPEAAVSLYAGWDEPNGSAVRLAALSRHSWAEGIQLHSFPATAVMLPVRQAEEFARFLERFKELEPSCDAALFDFLQLAGIDVYTMLPSPVDVEGKAAWSTTDAHGLADAHRLAEPPSTLRGFRVCPHFQRGVAYCLIRYGGGGAGGDDHTWRHFHWTRLAPEFGLDPAQLRHDFDTTIAKSAWVEERPVGEREFLFGFWITTLLLAVVARATAEPGSAPAAAIPDRLVETLALGGLVGSALPEGTFTGLEPELKSIALDGYTAGTAQGVGV
ncbi:hypothetical protein [Streptomyces sp. NPDC059593]|uniref:hypothetical protein n=1 Tax=Streptomyces sp. NPDC059593 TaxID=3346878 RepID=UPI0036AC7BFB